MKPLLIFDIDGTLNETIHIYAPAVYDCIELMRSEGIKVKDVDESTIASFLGLNYKEMWQSFMPDLEDELTERYAADIGSGMINNLKSGMARLYPGVTEVLDALKEDGYRMVLLSNCKKAYMEAFTKYFGLEKYFDGFYDCESCHYISKSEIFEMIKKDHNMYDTFILAGDRNGDISFADGVNTMSAGCLYGYGSASETDCADITVNNVGELYEAIKILTDRLEVNRYLVSCRLCARGCGINRLEKKGACGVDGQIYLSRAALHYYEEPCISGENGSGAIFFSGCNMKCIYCQNRDISRGRHGKAVTTQRLCEIFFELKAKGAENINLVTPTMYIPQICVAIRNAKEQGFNLPFIYNCGGYESVEALRLLDGLIDVYLPDFKYMNEETADKYSKSPEYPGYAKAALREMIRQTGPVCFDDREMIKKGVIVRHLCLPGHKEESKSIIKYLSDNYKEDIYLSIMSQYTPSEEMKTTGIDRLDEKLDFDDYEEILDYAIGLGIENAYIQEEDVADESFIPAFDYEGV